MNEHEKRATDALVDSLRAEVATLTRRIEDQRSLGRLTHCTYLHLTTAVPSPMCSTPEDCAGKPGCPRATVCNA